MDSNSKEDKSKAAFLVELDKIPNIHTNPRTTRRG